MDKTDTSPNARPDARANARLDTCVSTHPDTFPGAPAGTFAGHAMPTVYRERRERVVDALRAHGGGVAIVPTAPVAIRSRDTEYPYRHDSAFYYLSGFTEPHAWLVIRADTTEAQTALFCQPRDAQREIWDGFRYGPEHARQVFGFDAAYPVDELDARMPAWLAGARTLHYARGASPALHKRVRRWLDTSRRSARGDAVASPHIMDLTGLLDEMRVLKDAHELQTMRRAARISAYAHLRAMRACRPGVREYELEAELLYEFRRHGAQAPAYGSIVATGANACVLHYPAGNAVARDGELVLIDAGCELDGYASDMTRTFPANGRFTAAQRDLYEIVLAAQQAAIDTTRAGAPFDAPHQAAVRVLAQGMLDMKLLDPCVHGALDDVIASGAYRRFYMHRTSHWIGMDVHDCGDYREPDMGEQPDRGNAEAAAQRPWRTLRANMTLTIEPGLYVRAAPDVPAAYWNTGIRIEDDAIVNANGCELITRDAPVRADDIEAWMRDAHGSA